MAYSLPIENAISFFIAMFAMALISMIFKALDKLDLARKVHEYIDSKFNI